MSGIHRLFAAALAALLLCGCPKSTKGLHLYPVMEPGPQHDEDAPFITPDAGKVEVQYLGVGGFLVRRGGDAILFAPSFTNPAFLSTRPTTEIHSDEALVQRCLEKAHTQSGKDPLEDVQFLLVGHAHYDHLLDVPAVMKRTPQAVVVGSRTVRHILAGAGLASRTLVADGCEARVGGAMGRWVYNAKRTVRVLAIESEHSPHAGGLKFMTGRYLEDLPALPRTAFGWKEGQTYAYLVDFLTPDGHGNERVDFRLHFQDAASSGGYGAVPKAALDGYPRVDLAITCVGASDSAVDYPGPLLREVQPRYVVLGHWEDFFGNRPCEPGAEDKQLAVRMTDIPAFIHRMKAAAPDAPSLMPRLFSTMYFPRHASEAPPPASKGAECPVRPGEVLPVAPLERSALDWPL